MDGNYVNGDLPHNERMRGADEIRDTCVECGLPPYVCCCELKRRQ